MKKGIWLFITILLVAVTLTGLKDLLTFNNFFADLFAILTSAGITYLSWLKYTRSELTKHKKEPFSFQVVAYQYNQPALKSAFFNLGNVQNTEVFEGVELRKEPENQYDKDAIAVYLDNVKIGYVPSDKTHVVNPMLKRKAILRLYEYEGYVRGQITLK